MIHTIGHSNHTVEQFLSLLQRHAIDALADVRSRPYSRFNPQFNRETLRKALADAGIRYVFLGEELGARSKDPACYEGRRVSYAKLAQSAPFRSGLERLMAGMREHRIALMCAEREPLECHRTILIARELEHAGVPVWHILKDGSIEAHGDTLRRLVASLKLPEGDLFAPAADAIEQAYDIQAARIAYVRGDKEP